MFGLVGLMAEMAGSDVTEHAAHLLKCVALADEVSEALFKRGEITEEQHTTFTERSQAAISKLAELTADHIMFSLTRSASAEESDSDEDAEDEGDEPSSGEINSLLSALDNLL